MTLAQQTFDWIQGQLEQGRTVNLSTHRKIIQITPKIALAWSNAGRDILKIGKDGCLYVGRGKHYDCIGYPNTVLCRVTSQATIGSK